MAESNLLVEENAFNPIVGVESVVQESSPITLDILDADIIKASDQWSRNYRTFYTNKYDLFQRRKKNETFVLGRQINEQEKKNELKPYETRSGDNVLYEIESTIKPLTVQRIPDVIITRPSDGAPTQAADDLTMIIDTQNKSRQIRTLLGLATKHLPMYFTAILKYRWNPSLGAEGDYEFYIVHPDNFEVDETCKTTDVNKMKHTTEYLPLTVQEAIMRFPSKEKELLTALRADGLVVGEGDPTTEDMASTFKIKELWSDWPKKQKQIDGSIKWEIISMVIWKYKDVVLDKMRNPNWDWEGEKQLFVMDENGAKQALTEDELMKMAMTGVTPEGVQSEQVYYNYFDSPQKPYFLFGYDQYNKQPYDETSRIEQNLRNQENHDALGKQILDTLRNRIKHIFSKEGGMDAEAIENLDLEDPKQHLLLEGDVRQNYMPIQPERPDAAQFNALNAERDRMYGIAGANAVRGAIQSDNATTNQIARESDFTRADDLVEETINPCCEWIGEASMQMIKLRYTPTHFKKIMGAKGLVLYYKLHRDMIEDGMEVMIKSSSTDKLKAAKEANDMAAMQMIDPFNYFKDTGKEDPEGRTENLMLYTGDPASYLAKIKNLGSTATELATSLNGAAQPTPDKEAAAPISNPTPTDTAQIASAPPTTPPAGTGEGLL